MCHGVLIDGSHDYEYVREDIEIWDARITIGGILAGDDWHPIEFPGVCRAVSEAFGENAMIGIGPKKTTWMVRR
jgi:hypothetical protein